MDESVILACIKKGYNPVYGARPMKRTVRELLTYPLARLLSEYPELNKGEINLQFNVQGDVEAVITKSI